MDKNKSAVDSFLENLDSESNPFINAQENTFENIAEEKDVEEAREEKPLPFNKDPKIQKYLEKREREMEERLKSSIKSEPERTETKLDDDYYVRLIGNDTPEKLAMIKEAMARDERMLQLAEERAVGRLSQKEQEALQADREAQQELETAFETIEDTFDVDISSNSATARKTRQEFVSFVEKIAPKDRYGEIVDYPDMTSAWETFSEIKKATAQPSRAKELASRGMARSSETATTVNRPVNRSAFESTDNFLESLGR